MSKKSHKKPVDLDQSEEEILNDFESGEFVSVENVEDEMKLAKQAASNFLKRSSRVNIRVSNN